MQIKIEVTNPSADLLRVIASLSTHGTAIVQAFADPAPSEPAPAEQEAPATAPSEPANDGNLANALIAKLDQQFARAKTVTLKGGAQGKEGLYVTTEDGNEGLIVAVYRGRAVVEFEDGSASEIGASTLTLVVEGDAEPEEPEAPAPTPARRRGAVTEQASPILTEMAALAAKIGDKIMGEIYEEFGMSGLEKLSDLSEDDRTDFVQIVREEAKNLG